MSVTSAREQAGAGLAGSPGASSTPDRIRAGNERYEARFGFPFIIAVRGRTPEEIADAQDDRLTHDPATEQRAALVEVQRIAALRLADLVDGADPAGRLGARDR
jgi:2-oxo-4-hydroxy-4-carboxy-5-ureidoimidazoline decarboxylase